MQIFAAHVKFKIIFANNARAKYIPSGADDFYSYFLHQLSVDIKYLEWNKCMCLFIQRYFFYD